jgi:hypothetical protein
LHHWVQQQPPPQKRLIAPQPILHVNILLLQGAVARFLQAATASEKNIKLIFKFPVFYMPSATRDQILIPQPKFLQPPHRSSSFVPWKALDQKNEFEPRMVTGNDEKPSFWEPKKEAPNM